MVLCSVADKKGVLKGFSELDMYRLASLTRKRGRKHSSYFRCFWRFSVFQPLNIPELCHIHSGQFIMLKDLAKKPKDMSKLFDIIMHDINIYHPRTWRVISLVESVCLHV